MDEKEIKYTSTSNKLLQHPSFINDVKEGIFRPLSIQLAPTDKCNLNCNMCSVKNREMNELTIEQVKKCLSDFKDLGAKTVEFTGGGDPTMYQHINETIEEAKRLGYEAGMISNGVFLTRKISQDNLDFLTRLRISLNSLDYVKDIDVPRINGTLGFSYVWTELSDYSMLDRLTYYAEKFGADFVRVVPDCLDISTKEAYMKEISPLIDKYPKLFFQQKDHHVPKKCWMGYVKPFVNSDGGVYMCSANPLLKRKFHPDWKIGEIDNIKGMYENVKEFNTSKCVEGKCFFKEHNDTIKDILENKINKEDIKPDVEVKHKNFI